MTEGRVVTVSTIRDTPANVGRFVERNLTSGVDHMIVFLDQQQPAVRKMLADNPDVSVVSTDKGWWRGEKPKAVEPRQIANANVANAILATLPSVEWVVHLDGDEAMSFDRADLAACDADVVRIPTLEAASQRTWRGGRPAYFKRLASTTQLRAMAAYGAIDEPTLDAYYRGHVAGKTAIRPHLSHRVGVHAAYDEAGAKIEPAQAGDAQLLHYESWCLEDFVDRWRDFEPRKAKRSNHRERRKLIGLAAYSIANHPDLDDKTRQRYLEQLYDDNVADDLRALEWFGLLVPSPVGEPAAPRRIEQPQLEEMRALLRAMREVGKDAFAQEAPAGSMAAALEQAASALEPGHAARVRSVVERHRSTVAGADA
ncbi:MAG: glycosyltransferase family 2 protein [Nocardioidaceae bacterium]|nr:glycosyltransferase family 2 protein [Nocardioidaceae bacterium]MCL2613102.1 glycosyltransferase family 2 protein [Nocardioidaceae bacterium]